MTEAWICAGGGGVGKTTTSAAIGFASAKQHQSTLIMTVDPARRLATALGTTLGSTPKPIGDSGHLDALMPDPVSSAVLFLEILYREQPERLEEMKHNRVYQTLADAAAGMHEIVCLVLLADSVKQKHYDRVIMDTAPSRHALDFLSYPEKLIQLLDSKALSFLSGIGKQPERAGFFAGTSKRVEQLFGSLLNIEFVKDLGQMFSLLGEAKGRFVQLCKEAERLLLGPSSKWMIVMGPTGASEADAHFLIEKAKRWTRTPQLLLNRADVFVPNYLEQAAPLHATYETLREEYARRKTRGDHIEARFKQKYPQLQMLRLPNIEARDPKVVVMRLSEYLAGSGLC